MDLPPVPLPGKPVRADTLRRVIRYLHALTPRASSGIRPRMGPGGTTFELVDPPGGGGRGIRTFPYGSVHPFGIVSESRAQVVLASGEIPGLYGDNPVDVAETTLDFSGIGNGDCWIQAEVALRDSEAKSKGDCELTVVSAEPRSTDDFYRTWLYKYTLSATGITLAKHNLLHAFVTVMPRTTETVYTGLTYDQTEKQFVGTSFNTVPVSDPSRYDDELTPETLIQFYECLYG